MNIAYLLALAIYTYSQYLILVKLYRQVILELFDLRLLANCAIWKTMRGIFARKGNVSNTNTSLWNVRLNYVHKIVCHFYHFLFWPSSSKGKFCGWVALLTYEQEHLLLSEKTRTNAIMINYSVSAACFAPSNRLSCDLCFLASVLISTEARENGRPIDLLLSKMNILKSFCAGAAIR